MNIKKEQIADPNKIWYPPPPFLRLTEIVANIRIVSNKKYRNHVSETWLSSSFVVNIPLIRNPKDVIVSQKIVQSTMDISIIVFILKNFNGLFI